VAAFHTSVLADEVCEALGPSLVPSAPVPAPILVDATCGGGGHTEALVERAQPARVFCFDRDTDALAHAAERLRDAACPIKMCHAPFSALERVLAEHGVTGVSAIVADLGVSSHQLDTAPRGFSFQADGPLDMRMDGGQGRPASEVLAEIEPDELARVLRDYGDEPDARRIARAIVEARPTTTRGLAEAVTQAMSAAQRRALGRRIHPATRTFQAIRMLVNDELGELDRLLESAPKLLVVGGRLGIISFHSLEDRRVKRRFRELSRGPQLPRGVPLRADELPKPHFCIPRGYANGVTASSEERDRNPRARSARLRVLERALP
jgi:16S rRNA (cytosine1402-N4)-methyltransferase